MKALVVLVHQPGGSHSRLALMTGQDVAVDLEGEGDFGVAEAFADHAGVLAATPHYSALTDSSACRSTSWVAPSARSGG